jgi:D-aminoacyl-tRNA deacylase
MIALIQRVSQASVQVEGALQGQIGQGLLVLLCAERGDTGAQVTKLLDKLLRYRVFADADGKMNLSVQNINGSLLIVSQFTLAADTRSGTRPSFGPAADPTTGKALYEQFVAQAAHAGVPVQTGVFGADMQVSLTNDGPVTFWLQVKPETFT